MPGQANIKSVKVQLPKQLPSRLTTLQKACPEATFAANPFNCPSGSFVGGATGEHADAARQTDRARRSSSRTAARRSRTSTWCSKPTACASILVGNTDIKKGITTTTFASTPDVPVSSVTVNLPIGSHCALAAYGNLCAKPLVMPTTIDRAERQVGQTEHAIAVSGCGVRSSATRSSATPRT